MSQMLIVLACDTTTLKDQQILLPSIHYIRAIESLVALTVVEFITTIHFRIEWKWTRVNYDLLEQKKNSSVQLSENRLVIGENETKTFHTHKKYDNHIDLMFNVSIYFYSDRIPLVGLKMLSCCFNYTRAENW